MKAVIHTAIRVILQIINDIDSFQLVEKVPREGIQVKAALTVEPFAAMGAASARMRVALGSSCDRCVLLDIGSTMSSPFSVSCCMSLTRSIQLSPQSAAL